MDDEDVDGAVRESGANQHWEWLGVRPVVGIKLASPGREVHRPLRVRSGRLGMVEKITNH